jgi:hypothetical protein
MVPFANLLAVVLLTSPPGSATPAQLARLQPLFPVLQFSLQSLAVRGEILDPRELRYILARPEDFLSDLQLIQSRYQDLASAPAVADCERFPDRHLVNEMLAFNRAYKQHIDVRQPVELVHWWDLRVALQEADRLYQIWDAVRDARCDYYYVVVRRQALKRLRNLVGEEMYYEGNLPPCAPLWRFR